MQNNFRMHIQDCKILKNDSVCQTQVKEQKKIYFLDDKKKESKA